MTYCFKEQMILMITPLALIVSGCSTSSEIFDCEPGKGVGCQSITKVNKMIDAGHFRGSDEDSLVKSSVPFFVPLLEPAQNGEHEVVQRVREQPIRVWVAPYQDEEGNFHEASVVHSVIQEGYWQVQTPQGKV